MRFNRCPGIIRKPVTVKYMLPAALLLWGAVARAGFAAADTLALNNPGALEYARGH
jgi:hypothetical protein